MTDMTDVDYSPGDEVQKILGRWNPKEEDKALDFLVGANPDRADVRATVSAPATGALHPASSDKVDAQKMAMFSDDADEDATLDSPFDEDEVDVPTGEDGNPDYDSMTAKDLKKVAKARGLSKSGTHDDLVSRLQDDDNSDDDNDD